MEKKINIEKFLKDFNKEYNFLYNNDDNVVGYDEALMEWDYFVEKKNNKEFIREFVLYRGDFISSDREAVAFMFAMEKYM